MKYDERKNLRDFALSLDADLARSYSLSDAEYEALGSEVSNRRAVVASGARLIAGINPSCSGVGRGLTFERTVLGSIPVDSLLAALGLEQIAVHVVGAHLQPWCVRCKKSVAASESDVVVPLPADGVVVLAVPRRADLDISLREWCELLGVERAVVGTRIVSTADLVDSDEGEPILRVLSSAERDRVTPEIGGWFQAGGGAVALYHATARTAELFHLQTVSKSVRCPTCSFELHLPSISEVAALADCGRCRGQGWLEIAEQRFEACPDCDGFGACDDLLRAQCGDLSLRHTAALTGAELAHLSRSGRLSLSAGQARLLEIVESSAFADYPLGASVRLFSKAEQILLTKLSADLSGLATVVFVADRAALVSDSAACKGASTVLCIEPEWLSTIESLDQLPPQLEARAEQIRLLECVRGPLSLKEVVFPIGVATAVCGEVGVGKSLLLAQLVARFKKRRKFEQLASFGRLSNCIALDGSADSCSESVAELLGLEGALADEFSRGQSAKRAGATRADFIRSKSTRRCPACTGSGGDEFGGRCSECQGVGVSVSVSAVSLGTDDFTSVMTMPLPAAREVLWMNDLVSAVLSSLPEDLVQRLTLSTRAAELPPSQRAFLRLFGAFMNASVAGRNRRTQQLDLRGYLFVLDSVWGLTRHHQQVVRRLFDESLAAGATIIAAGIPKPLEKWFGSVVHFRAQARSAQERVQQRFFDGRFSRVSAMYVEPS